MKILNSVKDTRHAKTELRRIFVDSENMVSTNVRTLVIKKHFTKFYKNFYLMNGKTQGSTFVFFETPSGNCLAKQAKEEAEIGLYPNYKRLIPTSPPIYFQSPIMGLNTTLDFLEQKCHISFDKDELKKIIKACDKTEFTHYMYQDIGVIAICNTIYIILIMPS